MNTFQELIDALEMEAHPEGGFFKEVYRSSLNSEIEGQARSLLSSIYFLLPQHDKSKFHRIKSDELWYHHQGSSLSIHCIYPNGDYKCITLGQNPLAGEKLQALVPAGTIFGSTVNTNENHHYSLVSCAVAPGFDFNDFELFKAEDLLPLYPQHKEIIEHLC